MSRQGNKDKNGESGAMDEPSKIDWTHNTINPWAGCTPVNPLLPENRFPRCACAAGSSRR
jgi:hypothetical protein